MKKLKLLIPLFLLTALLLSACGGNSNPPDGSGEGQYVTVSIADAKAACTAEGISLEEFYVAASVKSVDDTATGDLTLEDESGEIKVSGVCALGEGDAEITYGEMAKKPVAGNEVVIKLSLIKNGDEVSAWKGVIVELFDGESPYKSMSIADARAAADDSALMVSGVVARITYANGMFPNGFILVDGSSSIYVYGEETAKSVKVGNSVTLTGKKTHWILEDEVASAEKFGYKGACQITDAALVSNDGKTDGKFDKSWIEETTVKDILDTPVSEEITSKVFKVNALIKKVVGTGFTNYYFFDLDGETGTYAYTQCNGEDFSQLDKFDGKICTVYITALNAKSTASDCYFRFLPVEVIDEGFVFDLADAAEFAVKYHGVTQFNSTYSGDPSLELLTSVSSELLGFEGAVLSFASSDESVVKFNTADGKTVFNCPGFGTATVTVTATYGEYSYSEEITVTVDENAAIDSITVEEAILTEKDTAVTVKGIVGPSLVNKSGFYLMGESGMIAVLVDSAAFDDLAIGNEVIISGMRERYIKYDSNENHGQSCIVNATVVANYYGNHAYATDYFVTGVTGKEFYELDPTDDYTTTAFILTGTVNFEKTDHYSKVNITAADGTTINLYCSGAGQYSWLQAFNGQMVTFEIAACNWNDKEYYRGCVLAIYTADGKVMNELNFGS